MLPIQKMIVPTFPQVPMVGVYGIVLHDTADTASALAHANRVQNASAYNNGITHFWVDESSIYQTVADGAVAWHLGVYDANLKYIGIEVCRSRSDEATYLKALQNAYELCKYLCDVYKLNPLTQIFHHKQFIATACPHRRTEMWGDKALEMDRQNVAKVGACPTPPPVQQGGKDKMYKQFNTLVKGKLKEVRGCYESNDVKSKKVRADLPSGTSIIMDGMTVFDKNNKDRWFRCVLETDLNAPFYLLLYQNSKFLFDEKALVFDYKIPTDQELRKKYDELKTKMDKYKEVDILVPKD